jgi:predicted nucleic acid-binding Zn ribbon protein
MKCPKCHLENRADARFCGECGEKLEMACPACGKTNPPTAKFCDGCGENLEDNRQRKTSASEGDRKYVTVLFSDLSGYTAMSERLDPE